MLGKDAAVCEQGVTGFGCMEGPLLFIEFHAKSMIKNMHRNVS